MGLLDLWNKPDKSIKSLIKQAIDNNQRLLIKYRKFDGTISSRELSEVAFNNSFEAEGYKDDHIKGQCSLRNESRTFKIDRIISAEQIK